MLITHGRPTEDLVLSSPGRGTTPAGYSSAVLGCQPQPTFPFPSRWFDLPTGPDPHLSQVSVLPTPSRYCTRGMTLPTTGAVLGSFDAWTSGPYLALSHCTALTNVLHRGVGCPVEVSHLVGLFSGRYPILPSPILSVPDGHHGIPLLGVVQI